MTNKEFVEKALFTASLKTLYVKGGFGQPLNENNKKKLIEQYTYNKNRKDKINACDNNTFAFDCCGLVKGIIWGFSGNNKLTYGGAKYKSNGLDDLNEKGLLNICSNISDNMSNIQPGEFMYMSGHCGIYIGDNKVVESSPVLKDGVQITNLNYRKWKVHGKLPQITFEASKPDYVIIPKVAKYYLKQGSKGMEVYNLQRDLNYVLKSNLSEDGIFGPKTKEALLAFQTKYKLLRDGIYGPQSYKKMREVLSV